MRAANSARLCGVHPGGLHNIRHDVLYFEQEGDFELEVSLGLRNFHQRPESTLNRVPVLPVHLGLSPTYLPSSTIDT
jgi:hypothetical protein